jgi:acyl-coenzyme A synthetase/AMP-(fatty) acid ligase
MTEHSVILSIPKLSWNFGLHNSITYVTGLGATAILMPEAPIVSVIFQYINQYRPTIVVTSPSIIRKLVGKPADKFSLPDSIRHFHSSGEDLPRALYDKFLSRFGLKLNCCIGMMETASNYAANPDWEHQPGTIGKPLPGCKIQIRDHEIYVCSPAAAVGYYRDPEKTSQTFVNGWVRTGDRAHWNEQGNLVFDGRVDDVFKVNDLVVNPIEIEAVILQNFTVDQVMIYRGINLKGVAEVCACIVPTDQFDLNEFNSWLVSRLMTHQIPKKITIASVLPETVTNKKNRKSVDLLGQTTSPVNASVAIVSASADYIFSHS